MFQKILVVLDTPNTSLSIFPIALAYAKSLNAALHLIYPLQLERHQCYINLSQTDANFTSVRFALSPVERLPTEWHQSHVPLGEAFIHQVSFCDLSASSISEVVAHWNADLIVLGQTLDTDDWVTQESLSAQVIRRTTCSVLLVQQHVESQTTSMQMMPRLSQSTPLSEPQQHETQRVRDQLEALYKL